MERDLKYTSEHPRDEAMHVLWSFHLASICERSLRVYASQMSYSSQYSWVDLRISNVPFVLNSVCVYRICLNVSIDTSNILPIDVNDITSELCN